MAGGSKDCTKSTQNKLVCANVLLSSFADVNIPNEEGDTPLICALEQGNTNLHAVALLLHYGADIFHQNRQGRSPLSIALESKNSDIIELLVTGHSLPQWAYDSLTSSLETETALELLHLSSAIPSLYNLSRLAVLRHLQTNGTPPDQPQMELIRQLLVKGEGDVLRTVGKYPATVFTPRNRAPVAR